MTLPKKNAKTLKYEQRLVLFLDFLGFKERIKESQRDQAMIQEIASAITHIRNIASMSATHMSTLRVTQFSDSLVVSYRIGERSSAFDLISNLGFIVADLAYRGFLVRGGVTVGLLIHSPKHLFGPGLVRAYYLESEVARFPRVIVDPDLLDVAGHSPARHNTGDEERAYVEGYLREDSDGYRYLDYISVNSVVTVIGGDMDIYPDYLMKLRRMAENGIKHHDIKVREKYFWLAKKCNSEIAKIVGCSPDDRWRQENSELYECLASLRSLPES